MDTSELIPALPVIKTEDETNLEVTETFLMLDNQSTQIKAEDVPSVSNKEIENCRDNFTNDLAANSQNNPTHVNTCSRSTTERQTNRNDPSRDVVTMKTELKTEDDVIVENEPRPRNYELNSYNFPIPVSIHYNTRIRPDDQLNSEAIESNLCSTSESSNVEIRPFYPLPSTSEQTQNVEDHVFVHNHDIQLQSNSGNSQFHMCFRSQNESNIRVQDNVMPQVLSSFDNDVEQNIVPSISAASQIRTDEENSVTFFSNNPVFVSKNFSVIYQRPGINQIQLPNNPTLGTSVTGAFIVVGGQLEPNLNILGNTNITNGNITAETIIQHKFNEHTSDSSQATSGKTVENVEKNEPVSSKNLTFACDICDCKYDQKTSLELHQKFTHLIYPGPYKTKICCKLIFETIEKWKAHLKENHSRTTIIGLSAQEQQKSNNINLLNNQNYLKNQKLDGSLQTTGKSIYNPVVPTETFTCAICKSGYSNKRDLKLHQKDAHGILDYWSYEPVTCCEVRFETIDTLMKHLKEKHKKQDMYVCAKCKCSFSDKNVLEQHMLDKHTTASSQTTGTIIISAARDESNGSVLTETFTFACGLCNSRFCEKRDLEVHQKVKHGIDYGTFKPKTCCKGRFETIETWSDHLKDMHKKHIIHLPEECNFASDKTDLENHKLNKHATATSQKVTTGTSSGEKSDVSAETFTFACGLCNSSYRLKDSLEKHRKDEHGLEGCFKKTKCCGMRFVTFKDWMDHLKTEHRERTTIYVCGECNRAFSDKKNFEEHKLKTHTNGDSQAAGTSSSEADVPTKNYECDICNRMYSHKNSLNLHQKVKHVIRYGPYGSYKPTICCGIRFKTINIWKEHLRQRHRDHAMLICLKCKCAFSCKRLLDEHELNKLCILAIASCVDDGSDVSPDLRKYWCEICSSRFRSNSGLQRHRKIKHPGINFGPYINQ